MNYITKLVSFDQLGLDPNELALMNITKVFFDLHREEIISSLSQHFKDIDFLTYEGGIDGWFGWGSVFSYELGLKFIIELADQDGLLISIA